jgi:hypothetical protein
MGLIQILEMADGTYDKKPTRQPHRKTRTPEPPANPPTDLPTPPQSEEAPATPEPTVAEQNSTDESAAVPAVPAQGAT